MVRVKGFRKVFQVVWSLYMPIQNIRNLFRFFSDDMFGSRQVLIDIDSKGIGVKRSISTFYLL